MSDKVLVTISSMPTLEEYVDEVRELWDTHWLTNMGVKHQELQKKLEEYFGVKHVVLYTNGHLALENALEALDLKKGGEIITSPFTFASTTHAIVRSGFVPVFCDINKEDYTIDVNKVESLITNKTVAIMPVHVYGNMCDVEKIDEIAKKYKLKVIYDAAHTFGVKYKGISSANFGDLSMFSFHATKVFHTIEGGCLAFNDDKYVQVLNDLKNFGIRDEENVEYIGGNAKMNEFQASMGICNLRHIDEWISQRKRVVELYHKNLDGIMGINLNKHQKNVDSNYAYMPVVFDGYKYNRDEVYNRLLENNIVSRKYFYPVTNSFSCYKDYPTANCKNTPIAQEISKKVLTLPLYADLSEDIINRICDIIKK